MIQLYRRGVLLALLACITTSAVAEMSAEELAKLAQNPVGNLISVPFQNNTNLNFGPETGRRKAASGVGKIFHFGKLPVNMQISAYYNVVKPDLAANWQIRAQAQFMFPK